MRTAMLAGFVAITTGAVAAAQAATHQVGPSRTIKTLQGLPTLRPGDVIEYHIKKIRRRSAMGWYEARAMVGSTLIAEAEVGAMVMVEGE